MKTSFPFWMVVLTALVTPQFTFAEEIQPASHGVEFDTVGCDYFSDCQECRYDPPWAHRTGVYAEHLYLRSRDSRVAYAEIIDGAIIPQPVPPIPFGTLDLVDQDYSSGYRVGGTWALDCSTSLDIAYTQFESDTSDVGTTEAPLVIRSLVLHPGTVNANAFFLDAAARYSVDYDHFDIDYRGALWTSCNAALNYRFGARYTRKEQDFQSLFTSTGIEEGVRTELDFEGAGLRAGLDAERHSSRGIMFYGRGTANFIAGEFTGRYRQGSALDPEIVDIDWEEGRIISILEFELGVGWQSCSGRVKITGGYMVSAWYNTVGTDQFIEAVGANDFVDVGGLMTFDGLTSRVEIRY